LRPVVRVTQAKRLRYFEHYVRLLIARHRFGACGTARVAGPVGAPRTVAKLDMICGLHASAVRIAAVHLNIATCGLMTCCACKGRAASVRD
jgi:hypothetical protein